MNKFLVKFNFSILLFCCLINWENLSLASAAEKDIVDNIENSQKSDDIYAFGMEVLKIYADNNPDKFIRDGKKIEGRHLARVEERALDEIIDGFYIWQIDYDYVVEEIAQNRFTVPSIVSQPILNIIQDYYLPDAPTVLLQIFQWYMKNYKKDEIEPSGDALIKFNQALIAEIICKLKEFKGELDKGYEASMFWAD